MKNLLAGAIFGAIALVAADTSEAAVVSVLTPFTGDPTEVTVTIEQAGAGVNVTAEVTGAIGDLRGVFLSWAGFDQTATYTATGGDVSAVDQGDPLLSSVGGNSNNINPAVANFGVEIGTQGIGTDDIQSTSFFMSVLGGTLLETDFLGGTVYARVMSVLVDGEREGSSKLSGELSPVPVPAAALLLLGGLGALGLMRRRKTA